MENQEGQKKPRRRSRRRQDRTRFRELPIYKAAEKAIGEFDLVGRPVYLPNLDNADEPSLTIEQNVKFKRQRPVLLELELDENAAQAMIAAGTGENIVRNEEGRQVIRCQITRVEAQLADKFHSKISFASYRQAIPKGTDSVTYPVAAIRWFYFVGGRPARTLRVGDALPLNPKETNLPDGSYAAPPPPNEPIGMKVAFYPSADGRKLALHPSTGQTIVLDERYPFDPKNFGVEIPVAFMQEERQVIVAVPYEEVVKELALVHGKSEVKLEADEIEWMGKACNVWELIADYIEGVDENSPLAIIHKARAKLGDDLSPDKDPVLRAFRDRGQKYPAGLEQTRRSRFEMLSLAFKKAIKIREAEEREAAEKDKLAKAAEKADEEEEKMSNHLAVVSVGTKKS